jgi:hypothetical protein
LSFCIAPCVISWLLVVTTRLHKPRRNFYKMSTITLCLLSAPPVAHTVSVFLSAYYLQLIAEYPTFEQTIEVTLIIHLIIVIILIILIML